MESKRREEKMRGEKVKALERNTLATCFLTDLEVRWDPQHLSLG
jgi:hypothetical protein